jgi:uncharacterized phage-associated protein
MNTEIATAVVCFFVQKSPERKLNDLVLMKLLYITERKAIADLGTTIIGDEFYSMKNGPVLSGVLSLMQGAPAPFWTEHLEFVRHDGKASNHVVLRKALKPEEHLSEAEMGLLSSVWQEFGSRTKWQLVDLTHCFPEWDARVADGTESLKRSPISIEDILHKGFHLDPQESKRRAQDVLYYSSL